MTWRPPQPDGASARTLIRTRCGGGDGYGLQAEACPLGARLGARSGRGARVGCEVSRRAVSGLSGSDGRHAADAARLRGPLPCERHGTRLAAAALVRV